MIELTIGGEVRHLSDVAQDEAMRLFWSAHSTGDASAQIRHIAEGMDDDSEHDPQPKRGNGNGAAPVAALPPASAAALPPRALLPASTTPPGVVSAVAHDRIALQDTWLAEAGFAVPPPIYAPGTRVNAIGDTNFRLERQRVERMPMFPQAAEQVCRTIEEEERQDHRVRLRGITPLDDGRLSVDGKSLRLESEAFFQLATIGGFGIGARYLARMCDTRLRANNLSHQFMVRTNREVVLRTRRVTTSDERQVFATVTPSYAPVDTDVVLRAVAEHLRDAHTEMLYDGTGVRATALFMPDAVVDLAAGDIFKVGVRIETDDTGRGRIRITGVVFRNLCLNLIIIGEGEVETVSLVHRGDARRILDVVKDGVDKARESIGSFLAAWGHARTVQVNPMETFRGWVDRKEVHVRGERDQRVVLDHLLTAWSKEPGDTLADCVNAVSRTAHETVIWADDVQRELERQASRLVYVGVRGAVR